MIRNEQRLAAWRSFGIARARTGRPPHYTRYEDLSLLGLGNNAESHMPLDSEPHWTWRNPLNILPATLLLFTLMAIIGALLT